MRSWPLGAVWLWLGACGGDPIPEDPRGVDSHNDPAGPDGQSVLPGQVVTGLLDADCPKETQETSLLPSNVLFVVDRSLSMACNPPPITTTQQCENSPIRTVPALPSKWQITRTALETAIDELSSNTTVGLSYFSNDDSCGVHAIPSVTMAPLDPGQRAALVASLKAVEPAGATPLVGATILAYQHLHNLALSGAIEGNKFVVLLTDGDQSTECIDPDRCSSKDECTELLLDVEAPKAAAPGVNIKTFVIGAPGSERASGTLSRLATAGGTALPGCNVDDGDCHFDMTATDDFNASLSDALSLIIGAATPCEIAVPTATGDVEVDRDFVNVIYSPGDGSDPRLIVADGGPCDADANGWQYTAQGAKIRLCGAICAEVQSDDNARVDVVLGCKTMGPQ